LLLLSIHAVLIIYYYQSITLTDLTLLSTMGDYSSCAMCLTRCYANSLLRASMGGHHLPRQPPVLLWCPFRSPVKLADTSWLSTQGMTAWQWCQE